MAVAPKPSALAWALAWASGCFGVLGAADCQASSARYCDTPPTLSAAQNDKLLRFAAVIKTELESSTTQVALIARSGLDLSRFQVRYSHAGFSLKHSPETPWAVRQLYFACDEQKPRLFDQGIVAFLLGINNPDLAHVSVVLLPDGPAAALANAVLDRPTALALLGAAYSANAYPFDVTYQNCNQWVVEMLASAWADAALAGSALGGPALGGAPRQRAQTWLREAGYAATLFDVGWAPLMWLGAFIPYVHSDDHPADDYLHRRYRVSMPASIEAFVQRTVPGAVRLEFCQTPQHVVVRKGWDAIAEGCVAGANDRVIRLD